jgi:hypothetical protein
LSQKLPPGCGHYQEIILSKRKLPAAVTQCADNVP